MSSAKAKEARRPPALMNGCIQRQELRGEHGGIPPFLPVSTPGLNQDSRRRGPSLQILALPAMSPAPGVEEGPQSPPLERRVVPGACRSPMEPLLTGSCKEKRSVHCWRWRDESKNEVQDLPLILVGKQVHGEDILMDRDMQSPLCRKLWEPKRVCGEVAWAES